MDSNDDFSPRIQNIPNGLVNRRRVIGTAAGMATAAVATVAVGSRLSAQTTDTATPEAETDDGTSDASSASLTDRTATLIASVQADRDAVASSIDTATIDELLSLATDLQASAVAATDTSPSRGVTSGTAASSAASDSATPAASSTDQKATTDTTPGKRQLAFAAIQTAEAARSLIVAELSPYGLPSQQNRVSRSLASAFDEITTVGAAVASTANSDASSLVTYAQQIYSTAYDAYGAGTYAQAGGTGRAAAGLVEAAAMVTGAFAFGRGERGGTFGDDGPRGGGRMGGGEQSGRPSDSDGDVAPDDEPGGDSTPVEVPAPSF